MPHTAFPGVSVSCPKSVSVNGKGRPRFDISLKFDPRAAWDEGVFDDAFVSQTEVDGWCILSDGKDTLRVGYVAVVDPASGVVVLPDNGFSSVKVRNFGPSLGWAEGFTLAKLGGEQQNRTYGSIAATGFRRADPNSPLYGGLDVLEFGFAMERSFEHLSNLEFDLEIDVDGGRPGRPRHDRRRSFEVRRSRIRVSTRHSSSRSCQTVTWISRTASSTGSSTPGTSTTAR